MRSSFVTLCAFRIRKMLIEINQSLAHFERIKCGFMVRASACSDALVWLFSQFALIVYQFSVCKWRARWTLVYENYSRSGVEAEPTRSIFSTRKWNNQCAAEAHTVTHLQFCMVREISLNSSNELVSRARRTNWIFSSILLRWRWRRCVVISILSKQITNFPVGQFLLLFFPLLFVRFM